MTGEIDPVVKQAAKHRVMALETEQPSLDEIFMAYYQSDAANPAAADALDGWERQSA